MIDQIEGDVRTRKTIWRMGMRHIGATFILLAALAVAVVTAVVVPQFLIFGFMALVGVTSLSGMAICAVSPPLPKMATVSIRASRVSWLAKLTLAMMVLPYTSTVVWLVNDLLEGSATSGSDFTNAVDALFTRILFPSAGFLAFVAVAYLATDLIRLGGRGRRNAVDYLLRVAKIPQGTARRTLRSLTLTLVATWWWTVTAFVFAPFLLVAIISQFVAAQPS